MKTLFDSSAFSKRYIDEKGSQEVDDICRETSVLALSVICVPEIISALNRGVREKHLSRHEYFTAKSRLLADVADAIIVNFTVEVIARTTLLLETSALRAMDALHVACALEWGAELFVSSDQQQIMAARKCRLSVKYIKIY